MLEVSIDDEPISEHSHELDEDELEEQSVKVMQSKFKQSVDKIVDASKTYFINEF